MVMRRLVAATYELQSTETTKPVPFLTRKHIAPTNFEKMNVKRAKDIFSLKVIMALEYLKDHSQQIGAHEFCNAEATITFMKNIKKWFDIDDVNSSNTDMHKPEKIHFFNIDHKRLQWLVHHFPRYLAKIKDASEKEEKGFLSKETYQAILVTSSSTVECVRYLLQSGFQFVLTSAFNSDAIELFFSASRQMPGNNDMLDCRAVVCSLNRILKTAILSVPSTSNIESRSETNLIGMTRKNIYCAENSHSETVLLPQAVTDILLGVQKTPSLGYPTVEVASMAYIGGYIVSKVVKKINCHLCVNSISISKCSSILMDLIHKRDDCNKLNYPSNSLLWILKVIYEFVMKAVVAYVSSNVSASVSEVVTPILSEAPLLKCSHSGHSQTSSEIICESVIPLFLKNITLQTTERFERVKYLNTKSQNKKVLRV
ncbi:uncharacterized protein [Periplaneta americana]|uniref:uncharacterized protein n=1 Tax=Periplaneta americana TaxID=6978 RepID=UPI0037E94350